MAQNPVEIRITAHATPHHSDPPNSGEFYAALGMFTVAWGRFEGHFSGTLLSILSLPEAASWIDELPISWKIRSILWRKAFKTLPSLTPYRPIAMTFIRRVLGEVKDRNLVAHAIWDEFSPGASEPTMTLLTLKNETRAKRKHGVRLVEFSQQHITISMLRHGLGTANSLNRELLTFSEILGSLRPPPQGTRKL